MILYISTGDRGRDLCNSWLSDERAHVSRLRSCVPLYGSPLTQLGVLGPQEFARLCQPIAALAETCHAAANKVDFFISKVFSKNTFLFKWKLICLSCTM